MIITLIVAAILIFGITVWILSDKLVLMADCWVGISVLSMVISGIAMIFCIAFIIDANAGKEIAYQNALYEKEVIEYRIDNMDKNIVGNELLYNDIVEFNNALRRVKQWANNPWTTWFVNGKIADINYIDFKLEG